MNEEIIIRKAKFGDSKKVAELIKLGLKEKNFIYIGTNKPWDKNKIKRIDGDYKKNSGIFIVAEDKKTGKIVGSFSCMWKKEGRLRHRGDCGWSIHPDHQGKGLGTKMLNEVIKEAKKRGLKRLEAEMAIKNKGSWKLAQKCGFKIEGTKKCGMLTDEDKLIDTYIVGRIL
jgi:RimJ/RimL family protein N-acetyltransferase